PRTRERTVLMDLDREYTMNEICIITRAAPARLMGLRNKGHLGVGADADIVIYTPHANKETMFSLPRTVIQAGRVIVENGDVRAPHDGKTLYVSPEYDPALEVDVAEWFEKYYSIRFRNYPIALDYLHRAEEIPCGD
ncbi:MAG: amidohydrolase family protein, partial [Planctomycetales bacterium]